MWALARRKPRGACAVAHALPAFPRERALCALAAPVTFTQFLACSFTWLHLPPPPLCASPCLSRSDSPSLSLSLSLSLCLAAAAALQSFLNVRPHKLCFPAFARSLALSLTPVALASPERLDRLAELYHSLGSAASGRCGSARCSLVARRVVRMGLERALSRESASAPHKDAAAPTGRLPCNPRPP